MVVIKFKPKDEDFQEFAAGLKMARMVTTADGRFRIGFSRSDAGLEYAYERAMWFDEVFYIIKGKMKFICATPPDLEEKEYIVGPGEAFFMGRGTKMTIETLEPCERFYCAIPASSQGMEYITRQPVEKGKLAYIKKK